MTSHEFARYLLEKCPDVRIYNFDGEYLEFEEVEGCVLFSPSDSNASPKLTILCEGHDFMDAEEIR